MVEEPSENVGHVQGNPPDKPDQNTTKERKLRRRLFWPVIRIAVIAYATWIIGLYYYQDGMIFPVDAAGEPCAKPFDENVEILRRPLEEGGKAEAWYFPSLGRSQQLPPLMVYFHGNAELIDHQAGMVGMYRGMGFAVLLPEYRGYGRSDGEPSQAAIVEDAVYFFDQVVENKNIDKRRIVYHGVSLGGGVAGQLARHRPPTAMILQSTFANIAEMAWQYAAPPFLARHPFYTDRVLADLDRPVLIFHGSEDRIIPVENGRRLDRVARNSRYVEYQCGHNNFPGRGNGIKYEEAIKGFLIDNRILAAPTTNSGRP